MSKIETPSRLHDPQRSILSLIPFFDILTANGHDPHALMREFDFNLDQFSGNARIAQSLEFAMIERALEHVDDPLFGFRVGSQSTFSAYGIFALTVMTATGFRDACMCAAEFQSLSLLYTSMSIHSDNEVFELRFTTPPVAEKLANFIADRDFAGTYAFMQELVSQPENTAMQCGIARPRPSGELWQRYRQHCHADLQFDQAYTWFRFPFSATKIALKHSNKLAHQVYRVQASDLLQRHAENQGDVIERCRRMLEQYQSHWPNAESLAQRLHLSERTLRRQLHARQTSLRELIDAERQRRAEHALKQGDESLQALAERLGYTESASFVRAFRRWTGQTPGAYKKQQRQA